jgi:predicted nucleic-acid-binding Zn-ribbon protein
MPKKITLTLEVPDNFDSFSELETFVNHQGQKLKQELCEKLAQDSATEDSSSCPKCGNEESIAKGHKPRKMKTIFGDVELKQHRRQCKNCASYFFLTGRGFLVTGMSRPN